MEGANASKYISYIKIQNSKYILYITKIFKIGSISNGNLGRIVNSAKVSFISLTALDQSATLEF